MKVYKVNYSRYSTQSKSDYGLNKRFKTNNILYEIVIIYLSLSYKCFKVYILLIDSYIKISKISKEINFITKFMVNRY